MKQKLLFKYSDSKSPLSFSPNYSNNSKYRRSTSPRQCYLATDFYDSKKNFSIANSNMSSRSSCPISFPSCIRSSDNITKIVNQTIESSKKPAFRQEYFDNLIGMRKKCVKDLGNKNESISYAKEINQIDRHTRYSLKDKVKNFKSKLSKILSSDASNSNSLQDENVQRIDKKAYNKYISTNNETRTPLETKIYHHKPPLPKPSRSFSKKRKLPARYLQIETSGSSFTREPKIKPTHIDTDLRLIQETSSEFLLKNLEAAKLSRIHQEKIKKTSILKHVNEESWDWSTPDASPTKPRNVHFQN
jgi:hypothetical protein